MNITFKKFVRKCPRNEEILEGKSDAKLIEDFEVHIDGEHRATFALYSPGRIGYQLHDLDYATIRHADVGNKPTRYYGDNLHLRKDFKSDIEKFLALGLIPTLAEVKAARAAKAEADRLNKIEEERQALIWAKQYRGVELYALLAEAHSYVPNGDGYKTDLNTRIAALMRQIDPSYDWEQIA